MSTPHSTPESPPARAVERIREIIVGRQLERIEERLERLETGGMSGQGASADGETRLVVVEARIEAMEHMIHRLGEQLRIEELRRADMQGEVRRMALHIQQLADVRSAHVPGAEMRQLEERIGAWLGQWQLAAQSYLETRDAGLIGQFRGEMASLWEYVRVEMERPRSGSLDRAEVEERFHRIAEAARALAASASMSGTSPMK